MLTEVPRLQGIVKSYNARKGFGFITADTGDSPQIFLHKTELRHTKESYVVPGDHVTFQIKQAEKGPAAVDVVQVDDSGNPIPKEQQIDQISKGFDNLRLIPVLRRAVAEAGYHEPTPIQARAIPVVIEGKDLLGCAQTGTGKTAAFALPILQRLLTTHVDGQKPHSARVLVLAPTRELALQIGENFSEYGKHTDIQNTVIFGGVGQTPQVKAIQHGADVLIATPGRLLDLIGQGYVKLGHIEILVLDEADRMLDMGFIHDVQRIIRMTPKTRQMLLFSATLPPEVKSLANEFMHSPAEINISPNQVTVEAITQSVYFIAKNKKQSLLREILKAPEIIRALVFVRTKHAANRVASFLEKKNVKAESIHGDKPQTARQKALDHFRSGKIRILVATDVAARGIDVDHITHVIQYDLPREKEMYVHRMGRTGRAGAAGKSIAFCDETEGDYLRAIERFLNVQIPIVTNHPFVEMFPKIEVKPMVVSRPYNGLPSSKRFRSKDQPRRQPSRSRDNSRKRSHY